MSSQVAALVAGPAKAPRFKGSSWLLGAVAEFATDPLNTLMRMHREHGDTVSFRMGPYPVLMVANPADVQRVLVDNRANYTKKTYPYEVLRLLLGNGLVTSEGAFWLKQRRTVQPSFQRDRMASFAGMITDVAQDMARVWEGAAARREVRDVLQDMTLVTLRVAGLSLISQDLAAEADGVGPDLTDAQHFVNNRMNQVVATPMWLPTPANRKFKAVKKRLFGLVERALAQRHASGEDAPDLLGALMKAKDPETGETMSDAQLADEVLTILMAGHETTSNALTWTFYRLSQHPEVARKLRQELRSVLGDRRITLADLRNLPYLDAVLKESMRIHPPVWIMDRWAEADDTLGGFHVAKGTTVLTSPYVTHRHPALWQNPEAFDPERWFTPEVKALPKLAYFPFSAGQRKCVGDTLALLEAPIILATLLQKASLELEPGHPVVPEPLVTMRSKFGMRMVIKPVPTGEPARAEDATPKAAVAAGCPFHQG